MPIVEESLSFLHIGPHVDSFGHAGPSGALASPDPHRHLTLAFCTNLMPSAAVTCTNHWEALVDAIEGRRSRWLPPKLVFRLGTSTST